MPNTWYIDPINGRVVTPILIITVVDSTPYSIETSPAHNLLNGDSITIDGALLAGVNGTWTISVTSPTTFTLDSSIGSGGADTHVGTARLNTASTWDDAVANFTDLSQARIIPQSGDTIKVAKSRDPISLGQATWTNQKDKKLLMQGSGLPSAIAIISSTSVLDTPITITIAADSLVQTGDIIHVSGHTLNTKANGIWRVQSQINGVVTLEGSVGDGNAGGASGVIQNITGISVVLDDSETLLVSNCENGWNQVVGSTVSHTTFCKEGAYAVELIVGDAVSGTMYGYYNLPVTTNFSSYNLLSFWVKNFSTMSSTNMCSVRLCQDLNGVTPVDEFVLPAIAGTGRWIPLTISRTGTGNLHDNIKSVAIFANANTIPVLTAQFDNIIACKSDKINLQSLISKDNGSYSNPNGYENDGWYGIQSITGSGAVANKVVILDNGSETYSDVGSVQGQGYSGTSGVFTTYVRETFKTPMATNQTDYVNTIVDTGITCLGGFDPVTDQQTGDTFFDGLNGNGYGISLFTFSHYTI